MDLGKRTDTIHSVLAGARASIEFMRLPKAVIVVLLASAMVRVAYAQPAPPYVGVSYYPEEGIHVRHPSPPGGVTRLATDTATVTFQWWCDAYETGATQRVLARYSGGPLDGYAAIVECPVGKGRVILLGTQPEDAWLRGFLKSLAPENPLKADEGVVITPRVTSDGKPAGCIIVNTRAKASQFQLPGAAPEKIDGFGG